MRSSPALLESTRAIHPLSGVANSGGHEQALQDVAFRTLQKRDHSWRVFGEVPTHGGIADLVAVRFLDIDDAADAAGMLGTISSSVVDDLSTIRFGVGYRSRTLGSRFGSHTLDELLTLRLLRDRRGLLFRTQLPSDLICAVDAYEIKVSAYSAGIVQAAMRSQVANRSWLVLPSESVFENLGRRATGLIERLGIGIVTPRMMVLRPWEGRSNRPPPARLNALIRSVVQRRQRPTL